MWFLLLLRKLMLTLYLYILDILCNNTTHITSIQYQTHFLIVGEVILELVHERISATKLEMSGIIDT